MHLPRRAVMHRRPTGEVRETMTSTSLDRRRSSTRIDGISALVTGGASGLGLATSRRLLTEGAA